MFVLIPAIFIVSFVLPIALLVEVSSLTKRIHALEERLPRQGGQTTSAGEQKTAPPAPQPVSKPVFASGIARKKDAPSDLEFRLGGKAFTVIGAVAVIFAVGFFLRYAFEHDLISPAMRVVLGFALSLLCLGLGEWLRKKFASYGQTVMGLGLGIAYLSWYAALNLYHLITPLLAYGGMIVVTAIGLALAVAAGSVPLFILAQVGGYLTPPLIGGRENGYAFLFSYLLILDLAALALAYLKAWREVQLAGMLGTALAVLLWFAAFGPETPWLTPFLFSTLYFFIFSIASLARYVARRQKMDGYDLAVLALNPLLYGIAAHAIIPSAHDALLGVWFAVIGFVYLALVASIPDEAEPDRRYRNALAIIGTVFLAVAVPTALEGADIPMFWAVIAAALVAFGYLIRSKVLLVLAEGLSLISALGLLARISDPADGPPWLNAAFLGRAIIVLACGTISLLHVRHRETNAESRALRLAPSEMDALETFAFVETYVIACLVLGAELRSGGYAFTLNAAAFAALAFAGAWFGSALKSAGLRYAAYLTYLALGIQFLFSAVPLRGGPFLFNPRIASGLFLILSATLCERVCLRRFADGISERERRGAHDVFFLGIHAFGLYLASSEVSAWFSARAASAGLAQAKSLAAAKNASLSVVWTVYALALLVFGIFKKSLLARRAALALFAVTIFKAFLFDTASLDNFYRFVSLMTLGVLLLVSGYLYHRFRDRIKQFVSG